MEELTLEEVIALEAAANVVAESGKLSAEVHTPLEGARQKLDRERERLQAAARAEAEELDEPGGRVAP